ncbi:MAG TPA: hypothetical protein VF177_19740 [Anaerolineae bacterium]
MKTLCCTFISIALVAGALFIETALGKAIPESHNRSERRISHPLPPPYLSSQQANAIATNEDVAGQVGIQATERISIPYGIAPILPLYDGGEKVIVSGHGGCTAGETVTVAVTLTQTTGASAEGQTEQICTGMLQHWSLTATATATNLEATEAEACGVAVTRSDGVVTDTFDWCRDVTLTSLHTYLPIILAEP